MPLEQLKGLNAAIKAGGATSYLEVVSLDRESEIVSAKAATEIGVDVLLGGTRVDDVLPIIKGTGIRYFPFPGRITGAKPPASADAVVIGGGIVGAFAAYYLARRGLKVALLEKGRVGAEQSSRNWGWCRQQNRDARELPIATKSLEIRERFAADTGEDTGFRRCGLLYLSNDEAELDAWGRWGALLRSAGVTTHMLDSAQASEHGRRAAVIWKGGVFSPSDGTADPSRAAPAVARAIMALGGSVHQHCAARGIETTAGRLTAVVTEKGTIRTPVAVMAGGAWASSFCRQVGIRFPAETVFTWPGMGRLFLDSLGYSDYPVVMGLLMFSAILVIAGNLIADIVIAVVDPRNRQQRVTHDVLHQDPALAQSGLRSSNCPSISIS